MVEFLLQRCFNYIHGYVTFATDKLQNGEIYVVHTCVMFYV